MNGFLPHYSMTNYLKLFDAYRLDPTLPEHKVEIAKRIANIEIDDEVNGTDRATEIREKYEALEEEYKARNAGISEEETEQALKDAAAKKKIELDREAKVRAKEAARVAVEEEMAKPQEEPKEEEPKEEPKKKAGRPKKVIPTPEEDVNS